MPMPYFDHLDNSIFLYFMVGGIILGLVLVFLKGNLYKKRETTLATMQITPYHFQVWQAKRASTFFILFACFFGVSFLPLVIASMPYLLNGQREYAICLLSFLVFLFCFLDSLLPYAFYHFTFENDMVTYTNKWGFTTTFYARDVAFVNIEMYMAQRRMRIYLRNEKQIVLHSLTLPVNAQDLFLYWCEGYRIPVQRD